MARRRSETHVSMFPFLSVLCAVIGVMVLIVVLVLSTRIAAEEERYRQTESDVKAGKTEDVVLEGIDDESYKDLNEELDRLEVEIDERKDRRDELLEKLLALEELLEFKRTEMLIPNNNLVQRELNKPENVFMTPARSRDDGTSPIYVEVTSQGYLFHPARESYPPIDMDETQTVFDVDPELQRVLARLNRERDKSYPVFLLHPSGADAFNAMRFYLFQEFPSMSMGYEPFSPEWIMTNPDRP